MDIIGFVKKLIAGLAIACILVGTVMAVVGAYLDIFNVYLIGSVLILVGALIMEFMHRKFGTF